MTDATAEYREIHRLLELYIEGSAKGDGDKLREVFHEDARMYGMAGGIRYDVPIAEFIEEAVAMPADTGKYEGRVTSLTQLGDVAAAVVAEDGCWGEVSFVDFFQLVRIEGAWKIVNKCFAHTAGEMPEVQHEAGPSMEPHSPTITVAPHRTMASHRPFIERHGLWADGDYKAAEEIRHIIEEQDLQQVRIGWPDQHGIVRGKSVLIGDFLESLEEGRDFQSAVLLMDTTNNPIVSFFAPQGGMGIPELEGSPDSVLVPDPKTFRNSSVGSEYRLDPFGHVFH